jgi:hypothetical protein
MLVLLIEVINEAILEVALCGMIYILSYMKIGRDAKEMLRVCLRNLRGSNVVITDGDHELCR